MKFIISSLILIYSFSLFSCSTCQKESKLIFTRFVVGSGGGATGISTGFIIDSSGNVYKWMGKPDISLAEKLDPLCDKEINEINQIISSYDLINMKYENIGNFYNFFNLFFNDKSNYIVWQSTANDKNDKLLAELYNKILKIIKVN